MSWTRISQMRGTLLNSLSWDALLTTKKKCKYLNLFSQPDNCSDIVNLVCEAVRQLQVSQYSECRYGTLKFWGISPQMPNSNPSPNYNPNSNLTLTPTPTLTLTPNLTLTPTPTLTLTLTPNLTLTPTSTLTLTCVEMPQNFRFL